METNGMTQTQETRLCPKDCRKCTLQQHAFCSAQMAYNALGTMSTIAGMIDQLSKEVLQLKSQVDALQQSEGSLLSPEEVQIPLI